MVITGDPVVAVDAIGPDHDTPSSFQSNSAASPPRTELLRLHKPSTNTYGRYHEKISEVSCSPSRLELLTSPVLSSLETASFQSLSQPEFQNTDTDTDALQSHASTEKRPPWLWDRLVFCSFVVCFITLSHALLGIGATTDIGRDVTSDTMLRTADPVASQIPPKADEATTHVQEEHKNKWVDIVISTSSYLAAVGIASVVPEPAVVMNTPYSTADPAPTPSAIGREWNVDWEMLDPALTPPADTMVGLDTLSDQEDSNTMAQVPDERERGNNPVSLSNMGSDQEGTIFNTEVVGSTAGVDNVDRSRVYHERRKKETWK